MAREFPILTHRHAACICGELDSLYSAAGRFATLPAHLLAELISAESQTFASESRRDRL
jgi:hypothetical protein